MVTFMVDLYHDGLFASNPLRYLSWKHRVIKDINFEGLRPICNDEQLNDFVQALFENDCHLDMYTEHQGYDVLEMINDDRNCKDKSDSDFEDVEKGDNLDDVKDIDLGKWTARGSFDKDKGKLGSSHKDLGKWTARGSFDKDKGKLGRPRKRRIRHPSEYDHEISRVGRVMRCHRCWQSGHNKSKCINAPKPKPKPDNFYEIPTDEERQHGSTDLLTAMGRDANNQMFLIAWVVVGVENKNNWCWFLSLLSLDLNLNDGVGLTVISDGHKGLLEAVKIWLPDTEHRQVV
nr:uncharacterized protein [Tanacetum cinerariifolium]